MPEIDDLRAVHDVLEASFADHFNSHEETFDEFIDRLRADPGHRWDHWWLAELIDGDAAQPAGALVGEIVVAGRTGSRTAATSPTSGCCRRPAVVASRSRCCTP